MDAIALEAGVGKGTLFRRFGDRASLALALWNPPNATSRRASSAAPPRWAREHPHASG